MVAVVGRLFQKWFPAQPNLSYTFIWDKTDAYGQRVYGLSEAVGEFVLLSFLLSVKTASGIRQRLSSLISLRCLEVVRRYQDWWRSGFSETSPATFTHKAQGKMFCLDLGFKRD